MVWFKFSKLVQNVHKVTTGVEIEEHVDNSFVLTNTLEVQDEWVIQLVHQLYFLEQVLNLLIFDQLIFALEFNCHLTVGNLLTNRTVLIFDLQLVAYLHSAVEEGACSCLPSNV